MTISSQNISLDSTERGTSETIRSLSSIKQVIIKDIKTPKTVKEFRENLKKYYFTVLYPKTKTTFFVTREKHIDIDEISNMDDVYKITKTGWSGNGQSFLLTPLCNITKEGIDYISNFALGSHLETRIIEVLNDPKRSTILEVSSNDNLMSDLETKNFALNWVKMDNQIWRTFFEKTLGEFSGY